MRFEYKLTFSAFPLQTFSFLRKRSIFFASSALAVAGIVLIKMIFTSFNAPLLSVWFFSYHFQNNRILFFHSFPGSTLPLSLLLLAKFKMYQKHLIPFPALSIRISKDSFPHSHVEFIPKFNYAHVATGPLSLPSFKGAEKTELERRVKKYERRRKEES